MSFGKVLLLAFGAAVVGGLLVAGLVNGQVQRMAENLNARFSQAPKGQSPMISGFNRPLEMDSQN